MVKLSCGASHQGAPPMPAQRNSCKKSSMKQSWVPIQPRFMPIPLSIKSIELRACSRSKSLPFIPCSNPERLTVPPRYCSLFELEPRGTPKECAIARIENFLHWMLKQFTIKKTSTVTTYWRQLSQLHIMWWDYRIAPDVLKADIRGRALRTVEDDELLTKTSSSRGH